MKEKLRNGLLILVAVLIVGYLCVAGVLELTSQNDRVTVEMTIAEPAMDVEHSAMGIIPIGKEHYFLGFVVGEESADVYVVRAGKDWADKVFGATDEDTVTVTALKKRLDYKVEQEFAAELTETEGINYPIGLSYYLDVNYQFAAVMKLVAGVLFLATAILAILRKLGNGAGKVLTVLPAITCVAGLLVAVFGLW